MNPILTLAFLQSFASTCLQRGVFFYTTARLGFDDRDNLLFAFVIGLAYVGGATLSHRMAGRLGERRWLALLLGGIAALAAAMGAVHTVWPVIGCTILVSALDGAKWPVVESYVAAGHGAESALKAIGRFNLTWSCASPLGLVACGPLIHAWVPGLFLVPALIQAASLVLIARLPARPVHLSDDHPARLPEAERQRWGRLLQANRALMVGSYAAVFILSPLLPGILGRLGFGVAVASSLASLIDVARVCCFFALGRWAGWQGRRWPAGWAGALLPLGFFLILLGRDCTACVLGGEFVFGLAMATVYYGSLYYALVIRNAAVEAGGAHEALIGTAFVLGPLAGLLGVALAPALGRADAATVAAVGPVFVLAGAAAWRALRAARLQS